MNGLEPDQGVSPFDIFDGIEELKVIVWVLDDVEDGGCVKEVQERDIFGYFLYEFFYQTLKFVYFYLDKF